MLDMFAFDWSLSRRVKKKSIGISLDKFRKNGPGNFAFFDRVGDPLGILSGENGIERRQRAAPLSRIIKVGVSSHRDLGASGSPIRA